MTEYEQVLERLQQRGIVERPLQPPQVGHDSLTERRIDQRADELAQDGFYDGDDTSRAWLDDQYDTPQGEREMRVLARLAIATSNGHNDLEAARDRLCERFVTECACMYRAQATQEMTEGYDND